MNAPTSLVTERADNVTPVKLRVLAGRGSGAEHRLPDGRRLTIGHSFENDIVLRDPATKGAALDLQVDSGRIVLSVISGNATVLGRELAVGERVVLAPYLPVGFGPFSFAIGGEQSDRWEEAVTASAELAVVRATEPDLPATDIAERIALRSQPMRERMATSRFRPQMVALTGVGLLLAAAGISFGASAIGSHQPAPTSVQAELTAAGFTGVSVRMDKAAGRLVMTGLVADDATLQSLREFAAREHPSALVEVKTSAAMASAAEDLLSAQGVDAVVARAGARGITVTGPFLPSDRQRELTELLRKDLPLLGNIDFRVDPARGESDLAYFFNAPGYGAASFVGGDPGYLVTEDGSRWFAGAVLPTGHRIVEIGDGQMIVERDGLRDVLVM